MDKQMQAFALGGLKDEGGEIDEASGNRVPIGGTKEGVRDDIPANVSEGEFIFPADVVRYHGLDKMMALRQEAKMGLKQMERMGQMGNSDEATIPDDLPFGMADLIVVGGEGEPMEFAEGGFVPKMETLQTAPVPTMGGDTSTGTPTPIVYDDFMKTPVVTMQEYRDANGNSIIITSVNGVATTEIPAGYTLYTPPANTAPTTTQAAIQTVNINSYRPSGDSEGPEPQPDQPAPDYRNMNDDEFFSYMAEQNGFGAKAGNAAGLAIATMVGGPVGLLVGALMRNNKNNQMANMKSRIDNMPNGPAKTNALALYKEYGGETDPKKKEGLFANITNFVTGLVTPVANALGINQEDAAKVAQNAAVTEVSGTEPAIEATPAAAPTSQQRPMLRPERTPAGNTQEYFDSLINKENIARKTEGIPEIDESILFRPGITEPSPMPQRAGPQGTAIGAFTNTDPRRAIPTGRGINMTVEKPPSVPAAQIPYTTTTPISVPSSTPDPVIPEDTPATGQVPLAQAGVLDDMIARAPVRTSAFTGEVGNQYAFDSSRANDAKLATEADNAGRFDQAAQRTAVTQKDQRDPYRDDVIIPQESKDYLDALNIDTSSPAKTKQMSDNYLRNRGDLVAPVYTGGGVERQDAANYLPASAVAQQADPRDNIEPRSMYQGNMQVTPKFVEAARDTGAANVARTLPPPSQTQQAFNVYNDPYGPSELSNAPMSGNIGFDLGDLPDELSGVPMSGNIDPDLPENYAESIRMQRAAQARAREAAAQRARIQTRNKEIATATSKIPDGIKNSSYYNDQVKRGYVGSTTGGYAVGKISGSDGNEAGVVQKADGKVTKVRDLEGYEGLAGTQRGAMTVFSDAEGTKFVKSTFGKKTKLNGDEYTGPGITQADKGGAAATATAQQITKNNVRYNVKDETRDSSGGGESYSAPADPPGNTGGFTSIADMFDGGGPGESAQEEIDRGGGDGGSSRVICTELYKQGKLDRELYRMDVVYTAKHLSPITVRGYHYWAVPMVVKMRSSTLLTNVFEYLTIARAKEIAHIVKPQEYKKRSVLGYLIKNVGEAICYSIGLFTDQKDWTVLYNKGIVK